MSKFYRRPNAITKVMNGFFGWLAARGLGPKKTIELEVKGRKSGLPRRVAVNFVEYEGQRYLVAPRGDTEWSRNAKADGHATLIRRGEEKVLLTEVTVGERAPIIQKYLRENAIVTAREFGVKPDAPIETFEEIAPKHPVFRIDPA